ncbi:MAG: phosphate ABC transporter permease PstA [Proteobacteria bacterium]|nr:phosphate ABC transporter permease PstA [Desulfobulbaceae bacterium]MBU4153435.1 phosphate ABC transporter permease PstA [Pseudomonadota bacterium]
MKKFWRRGEPFVWATGLTLSTIIIMTGLLLYVVVVNGIGVFWPRQLVQLTLNDGRAVMGEVTQVNEGVGQGQRLQLKIGNRDLYGLDFTWVNDSDVKDRSYPQDAYVVERQEYGNFFGFLLKVHSPGHTADGNDEGLDEALTKVRQDAAPILDSGKKINGTFSDINLAIEKIDQAIAKYHYRGITDQDERIVALLQKKDGLKAQFEELLADRQRNVKELSKYNAVFRAADGREATIPVSQLVRVYQPNSMNFFQKFGHYGCKLGELFFAEPRESNTEGGLFPAIFGTVMLVLLMSILSFPLGVISGIYLREYAKAGILVKTVRIAVNNLAGIPSIVYGIFGLGFFVYGVGGVVDNVFFPERLPSPTFGTGGILWASLTLGLLTIPVVIVATEEALGSIPPAVREGSLALGATKFQTLTRLLLPMASPGIMTGFILAMARAAGEVAPLMITGVVKLAPALPLDGQFPYIHLNRKFMHLGFHIYDIGFQSPNVEAAKPMVYVTTLLLILIVLALCSVAIHLRNIMRQRYAIADV